MALSRRRFLVSAGLADAMDGCRDEKVRQALASYVERITVSPSSKSGVMALNPAAFDLYEENDRRKGRSWVNMVAGAGFEPATFGL